MPTDSQINNVAASHGDEKRADDIVLFQPKPKTLATTPEMIHYELVSSLLTAIVENSALCRSEVADLALPSDTMPMIAPIKNNAASHGDEKRADDIVLFQPKTLATTPEMIHYELVSSLLTAIEENSALCGSAAADLVLPSQTDDARRKRSKPRPLATTPEMVHYELVSSLLSKIAENAALCKSAAAIAEETSEDEIINRIAEDETTSSQNDTDINKLAPVPNEVKAKRRSKIYLRFSKSKFGRFYLRKQELKSQSKQTRSKNKWWKRTATKKSAVDEGIASDTDDSISVDKEEFVEIAV